MIARRTAWALEPQRFSSSARALPTPASRSDKTSPAKAARLRPRRAWTRRRISLAARPPMRDRPSSCRCRRRFRRMTLRVRPLSLPASDPCSHPVRAIAAMHSGWTRTARSLSARSAARAGRALPSSPEPTVRSIARRACPRCIRSWKPPWRGCPAARLRRPAWRRCRRSSSLASSKPVPPISGATSTSSSADGSTAAPTIMRRPRPPIARRSRSRRGCSGRIRLAVGETLAELALQVSNQGRFDEAAALFRRATPIIEGSQSAVGTRAACVLSRARRRQPAPLRRRA